MSSAATNPAGLTPPVPTPSSKKKTEAQKKRIVELRRARKAAERTERERSALGLAQELRLLSDRQEFAPWRAELNALVRSVRLSGKRTPDRDVESVKRALRKPLCYRLADISLESELPERELLPILSSMRAIGIVEQRAIERPGTARGQREMGWFLTDEPARTPLVLP